MTATVPRPLHDRLASIVSPRRVLTRPSELRVYSEDGLPGYNHQPALAVFPGTREELIEVVRVLAETRVPFVPRGAGTGLSGGALADGTVLLGLHRMTRILSIDAENALAVVEPGVVNVQLTRAAGVHGLHYAPDPSSQTACTIGGNVAENAGGPHCLKYGVTLNHIVACTVLLPSGEVVILGSPHGERDGYDLLGAFIGSEGCFGVALDVTVKLARNPQAVRTMLADFRSMDAAAHAVSSIIASGIVPAALEMMDNATIRAVEASIYAAGYPVDAAAVLLVELDGAEAGIDADVATIVERCQAAGAREVKVAGDEAERTRLWQGRKKAFGAMGRISPHLVVQDAVVPRTKLPEIIAAIHTIGQRHRVNVCNVFHAGDGNLHPNIGYDANDPDESARVHAAMREIMEACVAAGGTITGEHGVGVDKLDYMELIFTPESLAAMCRLRECFDPDRRANPGKVIPVHSCNEWAGVPATWGSSTATDGGGSRRSALGPRQTDAAGTDTAATDTAATDAATTATSSRALRAPSPVAREVAERLRATRGPVRVQGARTWCDAGRPVHAAEVLDLGVHTGIVDYNPGDLTLTAYAGTTLGEIARVTAEHGQWLTLDPCGDDRGTIGATVSTASYGPLASGFGVTRDLVLGVEFVTGAGAVVRGGGRVVKNVAGFDLVRLLTGSWGTLGAITEVSVRLRARPEVEETLAISIGASDGALQALGRALRALPFNLFAAELVDAPMAARLGLGPERLLLARFGGTEAVARMQRAALGALGDSRQLPADSWAALRAVDRGAATLRLSAPPASFAALWSECTSLLSDAGGAVHAQPLRGVARLVVPATDGDAAAGGEWLRRRLAARRVVERLPAGWWTQVPEHPLEERLHRDVRAAFDPEGRCNPGILGVP